MFSIFQMFFLLLGWQFKAKLKYSYVFFFNVYTYILSFYLISNKYDINTQINQIIEYPFLSLDPTDSKKRPPSLP
jgi:hypothetical protein